MNQQLLDEIKEVPTCAEDGCEKHCSLKTISGEPSADWGKTNYSKHPYHWNLCDECYADEQDEEYSDDEYPADHPSWTHKWCEGCKSYNTKGKWVGCEDCDK